MRPSSNAEERPAFLGSFGILGEVASGDEGRCWICYDLDARGPLRLLMAKTLPPEESWDPYSFEELKDEARLVSLTQHIALPSVEAVGCDDGRYYVVYHLVEGGRFVDLLTSLGRPPVRVGIRILLDVIEAYGAAMNATHSTADGFTLYHLGVHPLDIRVGVDGRARLSRLGVRSPKRNDSCTSSRWVSAIAWAAPEHFAPSALVDERSDVYSLAALVSFSIDALTSTPAPVVGQVDRGQRFPLWGGFAGQFPHIGDVCRRALSADRDGRHETVEALEVDLRGAAVLDGVFGTHREVGEQVRASFRDELQAFRSQLRDAAVTFFSSDRFVRRGASVSWELRLKPPDRDVPDPQP